MLAVFFPYFPYSMTSKWATFKTLVTFHYTGWVIGILKMAYYNPHITGKYNHLYTANNQGFDHCSNVFLAQIPVPTWSSFPQWNWLLVLPESLGQEANAIAELHCRVVVCLCHAAKSSAEQIRCSLCQVHTRHQGHELHCRVALLFLELTRHQRVAAEDEDLSHLLDSVWELACPPRTLTTSVSQTHQPTMRLQTWPFKHSIFSVLPTLRGVTCNIYKVWEGPDIYTYTPQKNGSLLQGRPLLVITGVITRINGLINGFSCGYFTLLIGDITLITTDRGPTLWVMNGFLVESGSVKDTPRKQTNDDGQK